MRPNRYIYPILLPFIILIMQMVDRLFLIRTNAAINSQLFFGQWGGNSTGIFLSSMLLILVVFLFQKGMVANKLALLFIFSGAVSNLIDRVVYGGVIDYINIFFIPSFNLADAAIVIGVIFAIWPIIFIKKKD